MSNNPLANLSFLKSGFGLQIGNFRNSYLLDMVGIQSCRKLVYLDISENKLPNEAFDKVSGLPLLQYLSACENMVYNIPDFSNRMLFGFDLSSNMINTVKVNSLLINLRLVNLSNNQIALVHPLCMIPMLTELNLSNNKIKEVSNLYSISICQKLQLLDLSENPIMNDFTYLKILGTLIPTLHTFNRNSINVTGNYNDKRKYTFSNPLKSAKLLRVAELHLHYFLYQETEIHDLKPLLENLDHLFTVITEHEKETLKYLGAYVSPYLKFISGRDISGMTPSEKLEVQERRLYQLTEQVEKMLKELRLLNMPDWYMKIT